MKRFLLVLALLCGAHFLHAQAYYADVAVIVNDNSPTSVAIGNHFAQQRGIPPNRILHITTTTSAKIDSVGFQAMRAQIEAALIAGNLLDTVNYLVTTKGMPSQASVRNGCDSTFWQSNEAFKRCTSIEGELTLILGPHSGSILDSYFANNPYFGARRTFDRDSFGIFLVSRLDGYTEGDVMDLIDRSGPEIPLYADQTEVVLDYRYQSTNFSNWFQPYVERMADSIRVRGYTVLHDMDSATYLQGRTDVVGYYAALEVDNSTLQPNFTFVPGALAHLLLDAGPIDTDNPIVYSAGDAVRDGASGVCSSVGITFFTSLPSGEDLFRHYLDTVAMGRFNLAESYFLSTLHLGVQGVLIGDPKTSFSPGSLQSVNLLPEDHLFALYPNPNTGTLHMILQSPSTAGPAEMRLFDTQGRLVHTQRWGTTATPIQTIDIDHLSPGIYHVHVKQGKRQAAEKLVVLN